MEEKPMIHSKKYIIKLCIFILVIICVVFILASYLIHDEFRNMIDTKIFKKEVSENTTKIGRASCRERV